MTAETKPLSEEDEDDGCCEECGAFMTVEDGDDPTDICHSCAYAELDAFKRVLRVLERKGR